MYILLKKELKILFYNLSSYIVILLVLLSSSLFLWIFPNANTNILLSQYASIDAFNYLMPWLLLLGIPAITMHSFASEIKDGTLDLLNTSSVSPTYIVLSKFIANLILIVTCLSATIIYILSLNMLVLTNSIDINLIISSYLGILLVAICFISIGLFASIISSSQIIAFIIALFICFFLFSGLQDLSNINSVSHINWIINNLSINGQYNNVNKGFIKLYSIVYLLSISYFFLLLTYIILKFKNR